MASFALPHSRARVGARLDAELAQGLDPHGSSERDTRARWITSRARCERLAEDLERLVADARRPARGLSASVPFRRTAVADARDELLALAAALRAGHRPPAHAVALARTLLTDVAGPVYGDTGEDLRLLTHDIRCALEEGRS